MKYSFITQKKKTCPVGLLCRLLGVSRSAYDDYEQRRRNGPDDLHHRQLLDAVQNIVKSCDYTYGSRRIKRALNTLGYRVSRWKARRLMQEVGIQVKHRKKYKVTTDSNHPLPVFENQLNRQFTVARPDQVYVCDITCIWTQERCQWRHYQTHHAAQQNILQYIAMFYNNQRLHSYLDYKSPNQYEAEAAKSIKAA
ncbi:exported hypothetical protein [Nitrosomonas mobilis]|uniref:Transposase n=1 Tax=Nitrosomonas mobilis TaxID=51642 RepID=A0A1G5SH13_9PROT|nr:exported hypothetical protein [Nitrosomonas mobilis]